MVRRLVIKKGIIMQNAKIKTDFGALRVCGVQWRAVGCSFLLVHHTKAAKTKTKKSQYFY